MKVLEFSQKYFALFGFLPFEKETKNWIKIRNSLFCLASLATMMFCSGASLLFFLKFLNINIERALYAVYQTVSYGSTALMVVIAHANKWRFLRIFQSLQAIYGSGKFILSNGLHFDNTLFEFQSQLNTWFKQTTAEHS